MIRKENPIIWCAGCGLYSIFSTIMSTLKKLELNNPVAVSGIGCAGRSSGYFNFDSVNTLHGRAIPIAEGIKRANEKLNVFVFSGDGDLLGIGLGHLLHCSRRNTNLTVICADNQTYGMTGGQTSPTTKKGDVTRSSPKGSEFEPVNIQKLLMANKKYFYARTNPYNLKHMIDCIEQAFNYEGFSFVDVKMPCLTEQIRLKKIKGLVDAKKDYVENKVYVEEIRELKDNEYGVNKND